MAWDFGTDLGLGGAAGVNASLICFICELSMLLMAFVESEILDDNGLKALFTSTD